MITRFSGTIEELKSQLKSLGDTGDWVEVNQNQHQFRSKGGGVMNWYPSTGSLYFQGRMPDRLNLQSKVLRLLQPPGTQPNPTAPPPSTASLLKSEPEPAGAEPPVVTSSTPSRSQSLLRTFSDSELIFGLVGAVGTELDQVIKILKDRLERFGYSPHVIKVSDKVIPKIVNVNIDRVSEFDRITRLMNAGDQARKDSGDHGILASGIAAEIRALRPSLVRHPRRTAYIVNSLKHPEEVFRLRQIYPRGFNLIGVHPDETVRTLFLKRKGISDEDISNLIARDQDEHLKFGQRVNDTFHLSDFFVRLGDNTVQLENSILRVCDILFGDPYKTPTFDEFAMFLAFTASLRSADLSRQVGAVVARSDEILSTGANDCPRFGGGLYWPEYSVDTYEVQDRKDGRDYKREYDSNKAEQRKIIDQIVTKTMEVGIAPDQLEAVLKARGLDSGTIRNLIQDIGGLRIAQSQLREALESTQIRDLTEYGRVVHAEMEALLSCARNNVSTRDAQLFCTTFPCHNCAKHIVAAGIKRVVFIEPYQKSKAAEFHTDSISVGFKPAKGTVHFEPFVGIGPRRFFDLFSTRLGAGYPLRRKDEDGLTIPWSREADSRARVQMLPGSYLDLEREAMEEFGKHIPKSQP